MIAGFLILESELEKTWRQSDKRRWVGKLKNEKLSTSVKEDSLKISVWRSRIDSGNYIVLGKATPPGKCCSTRLAINSNRVF